MAIPSPHIYILCLLLIFKPVFGDWSTGDLFILVNNNVNDLNKVLEFNTANPSYPENLHPVYIVDDPGSIALQNWDYWYVTINSDNSYKIYNAYNEQALDATSDGVTPIISVPDDSTRQGWLIQQNTDETYSIYNHGLTEYLGLKDGGWPSYMYQSVASYTDWLIIPAVATFAVTVTNTETDTSTNGASTSTIAGPEITLEITVVVMTTQVTPRAEVSARGAELAKRYVKSTTISTTTITTTVITYVNGPVVYITTPASTTQITVTSTSTVLSTTISIQAASPSPSAPSPIPTITSQAGGSMSSAKAPSVTASGGEGGGGSQAASSTQTTTVKSGTRRRPFAPVLLILGTGFTLGVQIDWLKYLFANSESNCD